VNPLVYARAAWQLFRRDRFIKRNGKGLHFAPLDDGRDDNRAIVDRPTLCGAMINNSGSATTQPSIVGCWSCALAIAREPERWTPPRRARWETYPDGTTVCRTCGRYLEHPPGCSCPATILQRLERFMTYRASVLKFKRLHAQPDAWVPWDSP